MCKEVGKLEGLGEGESPPGYREWRLGGYLGRSSRKKKHAMAEREITRQECSPMGLGKGAFCRYRATRWEEAPKGKREQEWFGKSNEGSIVPLPLYCHGLSPCVCHSSCSRAFFFHFPFISPPLWLLPQDHKPPLLPHPLVAAALAPCPAYLTGADSDALATSPSERLCLLPCPVSYPLWLLSARFLLTPPMRALVRLFRGLLQCTER